MTLCIAGKNNIAIDFARYVLDEKLIEPGELLAACNRNDSGADGFQGSYRKFCSSRGIQVVEIDQLKALDSLVLISLEFDQIIPTCSFASRELFNVHFSLLPKYKGMYTSAWPILNGETETGVSLHIIDHGIDTGPIIAQHSFPIEATDTCEGIYSKYIQHGTALAISEVSSLLNGHYSTIPQDSNGSSYYSKSSIDYSNIEIDLKKTAAEIANQIRAYYFPKYQVPLIHGCKIEGSDILLKRSELRPGEVISEDDRSITIATIDYDLKLHKQR